MEGMATHSSILAWRIPMYRGAWQAAVRGVAKTQDVTEDTHRELKSPMLSGESPSSHPPNFSLKSEGMQCGMSRTQI